MGKKKLASLSLFLAILLVTSCEMMEVRANLVCDIYWPLCIEKCYKSGNCMRCCKNWDFVHGRCNPLRGMGCYCCSDDSDPRDATLRHRHQYQQQQKMVAPPPQS
ncbi:unnamed protein product [Alopecurus aequalis]